MWATNLSVTINQTNLNVKMHQRWPKWEGIPEWGSAWQYLKKLSDNDYDVGFFQLINDVETSLSQVYSSTKVQALIDAINEILTKKPVIKITETTIKWGLLKSIDDATGDVARTTDGWIEDEKFWLYTLLTASQASVEFDTAIKRTWEKTLKMSTTTTGAVVRCFNFIATTTSDLKKNWIVVTPWKKYRFGCRVKTNNVATDAVYIRAGEYDESYTNILNTYSTKLSGTNDWKYLEITFTANVSTKYVWLFFANYVAWNIWDVWFDVNSCIFEQVEETDNTDQYWVSDAVSYVKWIVNTAKDQEKVDATWWQSLNTSWYKYWVKFTPTRKKLDSINVRLNKIWSPTWNIYIEIWSDSWGFPWSLLAKWSIDATSVTWSAEYNIKTPCFVTPWAVHHYVIYPATYNASNYVVVGRTNVDDGSGTGILYNWTSWITWARQLYCRTNYARPTTAVRVNSHNKTLDIKANTRNWLIDKCVIDIVGWKYKYKYDWDAWDVFSISNIYSYTAWVAPYSWCPLRKDWLLTIRSDTWNIRATDIVLYFDTVYQMTWLQSLFLNASRCWVEYSFDGTNWIVLADEHPTNTDILYTFEANWQTGFYLKFTTGSTWSDNTYIYSMYIDVKIDTAWVELPKSYPTGSTETETLFWLPQLATTTLTYRATKYGFPAIEFANQDFVYLPFDARDCSACVLTAYNESASQIGTWSILSDGAIVAISSETNIYMVFDFVLTKNTVNVMAYDPHSDDWLQSGMEAVVGIMRKSQWLYYDILDLKNAQ